MKKLKITPQLVLVAFVCASIAFLLSALSICTCYYIHEYLGHQAVSVALAALVGRTDIQPYVSSWMQCPVFGFPVPQRSEDVLPIWFAGSAVSLLVFGVVLLALTKAFKLNLLFLWLALGSQLAFDVFSNFMCGTDNWTGTALPYCSQPLSYFVALLWLAALTLFFSAILLLQVKKLSPKLF